MDENVEAMGNGLAQEELSCGELHEWNRDHSPPFAARDTLDGSVNSPGAQIRGAVEGSNDDNGVHDQPNAALSLLPREETNVADPRSEEEQDSREHSEKAHTTRRIAFFSNWWLEATACLLSFAALIALCITLYMYRNKPSPNWPNWISLNTIVALYTVLLKVGILFIAAEGLGQLKWHWLTRERPLTDIVKYDDATRGPVGAVSLIWRLRQHHLLATCGALITVLALAVDPIAQQIIHYYDCTVPISGESTTIPRTNWYQDEYSGNPAPVIPDTVSAGMLKALRAGIFGTGEVVDVVCPTGDCTSVNEYSTLGWCSRCEDISDSLVFKCGSNTTSCAALTPGVMNLTTAIPNNGLSLKIKALSLNSPVPFAAMGPSPNSEETGSLSFDFLEAKQPWAPLDSASLKPYPVCKTDLGKKLWKCKGYGAARCQLLPCVKSYTATIRAGRLVETLTDTATFSLFTFSSPETSIIDTHCINKHERQLLESQGYHIKRDERWLTFKMAANEDWLLLSGNGCIYTPDYGFLSTLSQYLALRSEKGAEGPFRGTVTGVSNNVALLGPFWGSEVVQAFFDSGLVELDSVRSRFENISESMTTYVRQHGVAHFSKAAPAVVNRATTCIDVRWPWLAFPAVLVFSTLAFLILSAGGMRFTDSWPGVWKSSPLALLYHGFGGGNLPVVRGGLPAEISNLGSIRSMEGIARRAVVQIQSGANGVAYLEVRHDARG